MPRSTTTRSASSKVPKSAVTADTELIAEPTTDAPPIGIVVRQVLLWAPLAWWYLPSWAPGLDDVRDSRVEQAIPGWLAAWAILAVVTLVELVIRRVGFRKRTSATGYLAVALGWLVACGVAATPIWIDAGAPFGM